MNPDMGTKPFIVAAQKGERLGIAGWLKVSAAQAHGDFELIELAADRGPLPHIHREHEECFYIVEGSYTFVLGTEEIEASAGSVVFVPRGTRHAFRPGPGARALVFAAPGALLGGFLRELSEGLAAGRPEPELRAELAGKYDSWPAE
jgi:mannose-6-phosphate isomerase-like protein (cupin superfamily)